MPSQGGLHQQDRHTTLDSSPAVMGHAPGVLARESPRFACPWTAGVMSLLTRQVLAFMLAQLVRGTGQTQAWNVFEHRAP